MNMKLTMRHLPRIPLLILAFAGTVAIASAAPDTATEADQTSKPDSTQSPEFKEVQEGTQKYIEAYDKGDAKALAGFYAQDVDYINQDGAETKGRDAIEKLLAANFQANPTCSFKFPSIKMEW
jgi:SnoaL-like domain